MIEVSEIVKQTTDGIASFVVKDTSDRDIELYIGISKVPYNMRIDDRTYDLKPIYMVQRQFNARLNNTIVIGFIQDGGRQLVIEEINNLQNTAVQIRNGSGINIIEWYVYDLDEKVYQTQLFQKMGLDRQGNIIELSFLRQRTMDTLIPYRATPSNSNRHESVIQLPDTEFIKYLRPFSDLYGRNIRSTSNFSMEMTEENEEDIVVEE